MADIATLLMILLMAVVVALAGYFKSAGEDPKPVKAIATIIFGMIFTGYALYMNIVPTDENYLLFLGSAGFMIVMIEDLVKGIMRRYFGYPEFLK